MRLSLKPSALSAFLNMEDIPQCGFDSLLGHIRRDVQNLLNTRKNELFVHHEALSQSVLGYGMSDLSQFRPESEADKQKLKEEIENMIDIHEPRLKNTKITFVHGEKQKNHTFQFHIDAICKVSQRACPVQFHSVLEMSKVYFQVQGIHYE